MKNLLKAALTPLAITAALFTQLPTEAFAASNIENYNNIKRQALSNPATNYSEGVAYFERRDTPPSDAVMYANAQFELHAHLYNGKRIFLTDAGDAYTCDKTGCVYESAWNINQVFEKTYRGRALMFVTYGNVGGQCALSEYRVTATKTTRTQIATGRISC